MGLFANIIADSKGGVSHRARMKSSSIEWVLRSSDTQPFDSSSSKEALSFHNNLTSYPKAADILEDIPPHLRIKSHQLTDKFSETVTDGSADKLANRHTVQSKIDVNNSGPQQARPFTDIAMCQHRHLPHELDIQVFKPIIEENSNDVPPLTSDKSVILNRTPNLETTPELKSHRINTNDINNIETKKADTDSSTLNHSIEKSFLHEIVNTLSGQGSQPHISNYHSYDYQSDKVSVSIEPNSVKIQQNKADIELSQNDDKRFVNQAQQNPQQQADHDTKIDVKPPSLQANTALGYTNLNRPTPSMAERQQIKLPHVHIGQLDIIVQAPPVNPVKSPPAATITSASRQYLRSL